VRTIALVLFFWGVVFWTGVFFVSDFVGEINLIGDSLVVGPDNHHELIKYIQSKSSIGSTPVDYGHYGYTIADLVALYVW
jgi:hypothetical protein